MEITNEVLQIVSGEIEKLLIEQREGIGFAYNKLPDGVKVAITVNLCPLIDQISVDSLILLGAKHF